jgi:uncharacterized protein YjlB
MPHFSGCLLHISSFTLEDSGPIPNSALPVVLYQHAFPGSINDLAASIEQTFHNNAWSGAWRDSIYTYDHYHSTAHEVLGVYAGSATIRLGGEPGLTQRLKAGDVLIIPAGVAHKNLGASTDFGVVGAYPEGQEWDLCSGKPGERPRVDENIARVALPRTDPVYGAEGPLLKHWALPHSPVAKRARPR